MVQCRGWRYELWFSMTASDGIGWQGGAVTGIYIPPDHAMLEMSVGTFVQKAPQIGDGMRRRRRRQ